MSELGSVLLVEDDWNILRTNRRMLEQMGVTVLCAETLVQARKQLERQPDVLVLDVQLPDGNGVDFCEEIQDDITAPVLFLTAVDEEDSVIKGLSAGGIDYITKPYDINVFRAKIRSLLNQSRKVRQEAAQQTATLSRGPLTLDIVARRALLGGRDMVLTQKEFALLLFLARSEGNVLTPEELYQAAWRQPMLGDNRTLKKHLSTVRRKLEEGACGYTISAVYGQGYVFQKEE